jgi:multidrug resistance efflux pump
MKAIITILVLGMGCAYRSNALPMDSVPVLRAAELDRLTNRSIQLESDQYSRLAQWRIAADQLQTARVNLDVAKLEFERVDSLYKRGLVTEHEFWQAELNLQHAEAQVQIGASKLKKTEAETRIVQLLMLEEGNLTEDNREEMVSLEKEKAEHSLSILEFEVKSAESSIRVFRHQ